MFKRGRFSIWIRPISYLIDICIVYGLALLVLSPYINLFTFSVFLGISWACISIAIRFYEVYRFTHITDIFILIVKQGVLFSLVLFAYSGYHTPSNIPSNIIWNYVLWSMFSVMLMKFTTFYVLKPYRRRFKGNLRRVVILGKSIQTEQLESFFNNEEAYGYELYKTFDAKDLQEESIESVYAYIQENGIEEIYISLGEVGKESTQELLKFADNNLIVLKFLPDNTNISSYKLKMEYYGVLPIVSIRRIPVNEPINKIIKRTFDIAFSLTVLVLVLSWLIPLVGLIIKLDSKGPIFFKQKRIGLDYKEFICFKFRSMHQNLDADIIQVSRNDTRITRVGAFLRKTSMDELPQFINVFLGDMSIVGPRPLMVSHTHMYAERVNKFMVRHFIKPGITGLAQVSGFRGEVEKESDIINRVKYDIFYLENWSIFLDIKIILLTVYNIIKGEDKAY